MSLAPLFACTDMVLIAAWSSLRSLVNGVTIFSPGFQVTSVVSSPARMSLSMNFSSALKTLFRSNTGNDELSTNSTRRRARNSAGGNAGVDSPFVSSAPATSRGSPSFTGRTSYRFVIFCGFPFSNSSKSSFVSPVTGLPARSVTTTSTLTTRTSIDSTSFSCVKVGKAAMTPTNSAMAIGRMGSCPRVSIGRRSVTSKTELNCVTSL